MTARDTQSKAERKVQIWLQPYQRELIIDCLKFMRERLANESSMGEAHKVAGRYTNRRITEVLNIIDPPKESTP